MISFYLLNLPDFPTGFSELPCETQRPTQPTFYSDYLSTGQESGDSSHAESGADFSLQEEFLSGSDPDFWDAAELI
jgi:hypothetical protein